MIYTPYMQKDHSGAVQDPLETQRRSAYGNYIFLFGFIGHIAFLPVFILLGNTVVIINNLICIMADALCLYFYKKGRLSFSWLIFCAAILYHASYSVLAFGCTSGMFYYYFTITALLFFSTWRPFSKITGIGIIAAIYIVLYTFSSGHAPYTSLSESVSTLLNLANMVVNLAAIAYSVFFFARFTEATQETLKQQSIWDNLTGLLNRRAVMRNLDIELARAYRKQQQTGVLLADMDHFAILNSTYGEKTGDLVLKQTAETIRGCIRKYDSAGRYGGESFLIILPDTAAEKIQVAAEKIRSAIEYQKIGSNGKSIPATASIGIAILDGMELPESMESTMENLTRSLLQAKAAGRNRTCFAIASTRE